MVLRLCKKRKPKGQSEIMSCHWWRNGCKNWMDKQFKKRFRVSKSTFNYLLENIEESIERETTHFKVPVAAEVQLALTLYCLAHGCLFATVGDLLWIAASTACKTFNEVIRVIALIFFYEYVTLSSTEEEWQNEMKVFLKDWGFPVWLLGMAFMHTLAATLRIFAKIFVAKNCAQ